jgi:hypothetical protein
MNRHVNAISGGLRLRELWEDSLEILDRITETSNSGVSCRGRAEALLKGASGGPVS